MVSGNIGALVEVALSGFGDRGQEAYEQNHRSPPQ